VLSSDGMVQRRPGEDVAEPDRRVAHDGLQQPTGRQAGLHLQPERARPGDDALEARHRALHVERAADRPASGQAPVLVAVPEHGRQGVAGELGDAAAVARDEVDHAVEPVVQDPGQLLGAVGTRPGQRLAQRGEAGHVDEQHHGVPGLAGGDRCLPRVAGQRPDHVVGHEGAPGRAQARLLLDTEAAVGDRSVLSHGNFLCFRSRAF
jgi:hypothetical protein